MYVRGCVERAGRHTSVPGPAPKSCEVCQTADVPPFPARTMFVATTSIETRAGRVNLKWTIAWSRNPSPFGLTVVSRRRSPANGADPFVTCRSCSAGASASAARNSAVTRYPGRLQIPYLPLNTRIIGASILTSDEAAPHLCPARARAGPAGWRHRAPARPERRHALREGRARSDHDPGARTRRGDREHHERVRDDQRPDRRRRHRADRDRGRVVEGEDRHRDDLGWH